MNKKQKDEKDFSGDIDLVLSGRSVGGDEGIDEGYRAAIDFAGRIAECRSEPSPGFQQELKQRLLMKLDAQEAAAARQRTETLSFWQWLRGAGTQSPAWRTAAIAAFVVILALVAAWQTGLFSPASKEPLVTAPLAPFAAVETRAATAGTVFSAGAEIDISFSFTNVTEEPLAFPFPPAIRIETLNAEAVRTFAAGEDTAALEPGESRSLDLTWDQHDDSGNQVPAGDYQIVMPNIQLGEGRGVVSLVESPILTVSNGR